MIKVIINTKFNNFTIYINVLYNNQLVQKNLYIYLNLYNNQLVQKKTNIVGSMSEKRFVDMT